MEDGSFLGVPMARRCRGCNPEGRVVSPPPAFDLATWAAHVTACRCPVCRYALFDTHWGKVDTTYGTRKTEELEWAPTQEPVYDIRAPTQEPVQHRGTVPRTGI